MSQQDGASGSSIFLRINPRSGTLHNDGHERCMLGYIWLVMDGPGRTCVSMVNSLEGFRRSMVSYGGARKDIYLDGTLYSLGA